MFEREIYINTKLNYFRRRIIDINNILQFEKSDVEIISYKDDRSWYKLLISELETILNLKE